MWETMENKLSRIRLLDESYLDDYGKKANGETIERAYIPGVK
mgnify:FL=1